MLSGWELGVKCTLCAEKRRVILIRNRNDGIITDNTPGRGMLPDWVNDEKSAPIVGALVGGAIYLVGWLISKVIDLCDKKDMCFYKNKDSTYIGPGEHLSSLYDQSDSPDL